MLDGLQAEQSVVTGPFRILRELKDGEKVRAREPDEGEADGELDLLAVLSEQQGNAGGSIDELHVDVAWHIGQTRAQVVCGDAERIRMLNRFGERPGDQ